MTAIVSHCCEPQLTRTTEKDGSSFTVSQGTTYNTEELYAKPIPLALRFKDSDRTGGGGNGELQGRGCGIVNPNYAMPSEEPYTQFPVTSPLVMPRVVANGQYGNSPALPGSPHRHPQAGKRHHRRDSHGGAEGGIPPFHGLEMMTEYRNVSMYPRGRHGDSKRYEIGRQADSEGYVCVCVFMLSRKGSVGVRLEAGEAFAQQCTNVCVFCMPVCVRVCL